MGSGGKTTHATYDTAPTAAAVMDEEEEETPTGANLPHDHDVLDIQALAQFDIYAATNGTDTPLQDWHSDLQFSAGAAEANIEQLAPSDQPAAQAELESALQGALAALTPEQLNELAKSKGFTHPELVGIAEGQPHPLAVWLSPTTPDMTKMRIQAKANERFAALCAGESVAGLSYADIEAPSPADGTWTATPQELSELASQVHANIVTAEMYAGPTRADALAAAVAAEQHLATAYCPAATDEQVDAAQAPATAAIDDFTEGMSPGSKAFAPVLEQAKADGHLSAEQWAVLSRPEALRLARVSTPTAEQFTLQATAVQRLQQLSELKDGYDWLIDHAAPHESGWQIHLPDTLTTTSDPAASPVVDLAKGAEAYVHASAQMGKWANLAPVHMSNDFPEGVKLPPHPHAPSPGKLTKAFTIWASQPGVDNAALKQAAAALGMPEAGANVYDAKKWIAGHWDSTIDQGDLAAHIEAKAAKPTNPVKAPTDGSAKSQSHKPPSPPTEKPMGWATQHGQLVAALKAQSAVSEVPKPVDAAVVAGHDFGTGTSATGLGGVHTKSVHTGPDGGKWLFKPDKAGGGARAEAEAVVSTIAQAAGVPSVPVYSTKVHGQRGVVQPLVPGATQLSATPSNWTQGEVDSLVRAHVVSWAVGDHDANPSNMLKTPSGGMVGVDAGQAFKYYGKDKLQLDYHPNAAFGTSEPAHHQAYKAAKTGGLSHGVKVNPAVAHPVIAKLEAIPDSQWRAMLHATAHRGAKQPDSVAWVPTMRDHAAKQLGISASAVSPSQVAEAFLDYACERKKSLRADFAHFFTTELKLNGHALKYAGHSEAS